MEKFGKLLLFFGLILIVFITIVFLWKESILDFSEQLNFNKFSQYGTVLGGILGSIWALAGILLYYSALLKQQDLLNEQKKQIEDNNKTLKKQTSVLEDQNFENSLFSISDQWFRTTSMLIYNYNNRNNGKLVGKICFRKYYDDFRKEYSKLNNEKIEEDKISKAYCAFYSKTNGWLDHYFLTFYELLKLINSKCNGSDEDKISYAGIVRSQITKNELLLLFYNSLSKKHGRIKTLDLMRKYNLIKRLDIESLISPDHIELFNTVKGS